MIKMLQQVKDGQNALIRDISGGHSLRQRLFQIGLYPGERIRVLRSGFLGGPVLVAVNGSEVAIGQGMARKIEVEVFEA